MWYVEIIESLTGEVVDRIACKSERQADKVEDGICINLDWENYETRVVCDEIGT